MTVRELLASVDNREFSEWQAFYELEPFSPRAYHVSQVMAAAVVSNMMRGKGSKAVTPYDFIPGDISDIREAMKPRPQTAEEQWRIITSLFSAHNARLDKAGKD